MINGDATAFNWIYNKYWCMLCGHARLFFKVSMENAEDIVQEVLMKLWLDHKTLQITVSLQAYLFTCVRNKWRDYVEHENVKRKHTQSIIENSNLSLTQDSNCPLTTMISHETMNVILKIIDNLPEQCREVTKLSWIEGLCYQEIAKKIGISTDAVGVQIYRAREILQKSLKIKGKRKLL